MTHPVDIYVGKRLKQSRLASGMSQEALAHTVGVTFQQIQKYERGSNRMGASRLYEFSKILNVSVDYFFEGFEDSEPLTKPTGMAESRATYQHEPSPAGREALEFVRAYQKLRDPKTRKAVNDLIRSLAEGRSIV